ncbi:hypothetical protein PMIN02_012231 [Paraphaeosphaeria minitans]
MKIELNWSVSKPVVHSDVASEVLSAAGIDLSTDDPDLPCLTLRMWTIGIFFTLLGCGLNTLYTLRFPSISLTQSAVQFLAFPMGKAWEMTIPDWTIPIVGWKLNPGRFNKKENILIYIMANLSFLTRLSADVLTEQRIFFGYKTGWGFEMLITLATILFGFSIAGICKTIVVDPPAMAYPGVFANTALNSALHGGKEQGESKNVWRTSRYTFFVMAFAASFCWYWFPDFIFPALGYFTFLCWAAPKNTVVNQLFGMKNGLGLLPITFDWSQIAYIGSPLVVPTWAIANVFAALIVWVYIVSPALYYTNTWNSAYLPIQSNSVFDNTGHTYNVSRIINKQDGYRINLVKYADYSTIYLPVTYALNQFGLAFATVLSLFVWVVLEERDQVLHGLRSGWRSIRMTLDQSPKYPERGQPIAYPSTPTWWYWITAIISIALAIFCCEYWKVQLPWYGVLLAFAISTVFFVPLCIIYGTTNLRINIDIFCRIIAGYIWEGRVLANVWFFNLGYISGIKALQFSQDFKLGYYCGVHSPPFCSTAPFQLTHAADPPTRPLHRPAGSPLHRDPRPGRRPQLGPHAHQKRLRRRRPQRLHLPLLANPLQHQHHLGRRGTTPLLLPGRDVPQPPLLLHPRPSPPGAGVPPQAPLPDELLETCPRAAAAGRPQLPAPRVGDELRELGRRRAGVWRLHQAQTCRVVAAAHVRAERGAG